MNYLTDQQVKDKLHEEEYNAVILNYLDFARYLADRMANKCMTHEREDLRAEAFLVLTVSVNKLKGHPNPGGFIREAIKGRLKDTVLRDYLVYRPYGSKDHMEQWIYLEDIPHEESELAVPKECQAPARPEGYIEEQNIMDSVLLSEIEKKVIKLKIDGFTLQEIAIQCKMPYVQIQRILQGTRSRVHEILHGSY